MYFFIVAFSVFVLEFKHVLTSLAYLEFLVLTIFIFLSSLPYNIDDDFVHSLFFIAVAVCEAAIGLAITTLYANKKGNQLVATY